MLKKVEFEYIEKELWESVKEAEKNEKYHTAAILLAKLSFLKINKFLYENFGIIPKDHKERFELVEKYLGDIKEDFLRLFFPV